MGIENVPTQAFKPRNAGNSQFPAFYWTEDGTQILAKSAADIPEGATPYHPKDAHAHIKADVDYSADAAEDIAEVNNVPTRVFRPRNAGKAHFPAFYWTEDGTQVLAHSADDIPEGATPYHPKDPHAKAKAATHPAAPKATGAKSNIAPPRGSGAPAPAPAPGDGEKIPPRADVIAALTKRGIKFNAQSPTKVLYTLLHGYIAENES